MRQRWKPILTERLVQVQVARERKGDEKIALGMQVVLCGTGGKHSSTDYDDMCSDKGG